MKSSTTIAASRDIDSPLLHYFFLHLFQFLFAHLIGLTLLRVDLIGLLRVADVGGIAHVVRRTDDQLLQTERIQALYPPVRASAAVHLAQRQVGMAAVQQRQVLIHGDHPPQRTGTQQLLNARPGHQVADGPVGVARTDEGRVDGLLRSRVAIQLPTEVQKVVLSSSFFRLQLLKASPGGGPLGAKVALKADVVLEDDDLGGNGMRL